MVPGIFHVHHSVGVVRIDHVDNHGHISSLECMRQKIQKIVLTTNPITERHKTWHKYTLNFGCNPPGHVSCFGHVKLK